MSLLDEEKDWMDKSQQIAVEVWAEENIKCIKYPEYEPQHRVMVTKNSISYNGSVITINNFIPSVIDTIEGPMVIVKLNETESTYLPKHFICNSEGQNYKTFKLETYPNIQEHNYHGTFNPLELENIKFEKFTHLKFSGTNLSKIRGEAIGDPNESYLYLHFDGTLIESFNDINGLVPVWDINSISLDISNTKLSHHLIWEVADIDKVSQIIDSQYAWAYNLKQIRLSPKILIERIFNYNLDGSKKSRWSLSNSSIRYLDSLTIKDAPF